MKTKRKPKQKAQPNPLPCGCAAVGEWDLEGAYDDGHCLRVGWKSVHVKHCPLHAAAPDFLQACKTLIDAVDQHSRNQTVQLDPHGPLLNGLRAAIAKVKP
jgi:hypothetical protein